MNMQPLSFCRICLSIKGDLKSRCAERVKELFCSLRGEGRDMARANMALKLGWQPQSPCLTQSAPKSPVRKHKQFILLCKIHSMLPLLRAHLMAAKYL